MASQTFNLGRPSATGARFIYGWQTLSIAIDGALAAGGAASGTRLRGVTLPKVTGQSISLSTRRQEDFTQQDLTPAWEGNDAALTVIRTRSGVETQIVIPGPTATGSSDDSDAPYTWTSPNYTDVLAFAADERSTDTYVIILSDEPAYTPTLKVGSKFVERLKIGSQFVGALKYPIESEFAYVAPGFTLPDPVPAFTADYTVVAGTASGWTGYWFNNDGSIVGGSYTFTRPDGSSSSVRQTMVQNRTAPFRFAMTTQGLNISQFPPTITTVAGDTSVTWDRPSSSFNVGQGSAANYTTSASTADVQAVFADNNNIEVSLNYP